MNPKTNCTEKDVKILITGGSGQLGTNLTKFLTSIYGHKNVIVSDIKPPLNIASCSNPFECVSVLNKERLNEIIEYYKINWLIHLASILSANAEDNLHLAMEVNIMGLHNVLDAARVYNLKIFIPSSIAAFGTKYCPSVNTPNITVQKPKTFYGISKMYAELLGQYYYKKYNVDFRSLRLPGIISSNNPGGGTTDYAIAMLQAAIKQNNYNCYLEKNTILPMMYIDDCERAIHKLMIASADSLRTRVYNVTGLSFSPEELAQEIINTGIPDFTVTYVGNDHRQIIANSWPISIDDNWARTDWGWKPQYALTDIVHKMFEKLTIENR